MSTSKLQELLKNASSVVLKPTDRFHLHKSDGVFFVEEGEVNLYLLKPKNQMEGPLTFLRTVVQGELIFPFPPVSKESCCLIALAYKKTVLRELPVSAINNREVQEEFAPLVLNWLSGFSSILNIKKALEIDQYLENGTSFSLSAGQTVMFPNTSLSETHLDLAWMRVLKGRLVIATLPNFELTPGLPPFPLLPLTTLQAPEDSSLEIEPYPYWSSSGVSLFNEFLLQKLVAIDEEKLLEEQANLSELIRYEGNQKKKLIENIENLFSSGEIVSKSTSDNEIVQTIQVLEKAMHQPLLDSEKSPEGGHPAINPVVKQRKVTLKTGWWTRDSRPLLGCLDPETKPTFVALIPDPPRGYLMVKPGSPNPIRVDAALAKQIDSTATMFYRVFSQKGETSFLKFFKFGLTGRLKDIFICLVVSLLVTLLGLFVAMANSVIFDFVIPSSDPVLLWQIVAGLSIAALVSAIFMSAREISILRLEANCYHDMETSLWQHTFDLPMKFFRKYSTGDLIQRLEGFTSIRALLSGNAIRIIISTLFSVTYIALMLYYSPLLTVVMLGLLAVLAVISYVCLYFSTKIASVIQEASGILYGKTVQTIAGISKIRTNGVESRFFDNWENHFLHIKGLQIKAGRIGMLKSIASSLFSHISFILILVIFILLGMQKAEGKEIEFITVGSYLAFYAAFMGFYGVFNDFSDIISSAIACYPLWNRIKVVLDEPGENASKQLKYQVGALTGEVRLDHIYFRYDPNSAFIHEDISIHAEPGEFIAIVGHSGCGKSSLVRLLLGFDEPEMGAVYYNGKDLKDLDLRDVRSQIGTVLQNSMVMHGSIRDNITGGRVASDEQIMRAVRLAAFDTDLAAMPMGLSTPLISGGTGLSGGQRQRLFMARVLLGEPKILILDEATNALDNITQERMVSNLDNCHVTRIVIAHRLSTIRKAHRIYVLDKGKVVQTGTFDELCTQKGIFAEFVENQKL